MSVVCNRSFGRRVSSNAALLEASQERHTHRVREMQVDEDMPVRIKRAVSDACK